MTLLLLARRGKWRIVFDPDFTSARKLKAAKRAESFKKLEAQKASKSEMPVQKQKPTRSVSRDEKDGKKPAGVGSPAGKATSETNSKEMSKKKGLSDSRKAKSRRSGPSLSS